MQLRKPRNVILRIPIVTCMLSNPCGVGHLFKVEQQQELDVRFRVSRYPFRL
jgi:hypothetical protein